MKALLDTVRWFVDRYGYWIGILTPFLGILAFVETKLGIMTGAMEDATVKLAALRGAVGATWGAAGPYVAYANSMFPLEETLYMAGLWLTVKIVMVIIRWIKGLIPTYG